MKSNHCLRTLTYFSILFMTISVSFPSYINSSLLKNFVGEKGIGLIYGISSLLTILLIFYTIKLLNYFGNLKLITLSALISIFSLIGLILTRDTPFVLLFFIIYYSLSFNIRHLLDIYLENISDDHNTGSIRGLYLTFYNTAWLISPLLASFFVAGGNIWIVYCVAGFTLLPLITLTSVFLTEKTRTNRKPQNIWQALKKLYTGRKNKTKNIYNILVVDFFLNFFYAVMVVYLPLYLYNHIGLTWQEIGITFTIMLLPFVLFQLPLGKIADKWLGEKELLVLGFIIAGGSTIIATFLNSLNWQVWAFLLFLNRTGAASIEIMKEAYLFKKISGKDTDIISLSRINNPLSYLLGPIFASLMLVFFDFKYIFLVLGLFTLLGVKYAWQLIDTK